MPLFSLSWGDKGLTVEPDRLAFYWTLQLEIQTSVDPSREITGRIEVSRGLDVALGSAVRGQSHAPYNAYTS